MLTPLDRAMASWFVTFAVLLSHWEICEALQPGQQYARSYLPCALVASMVAPNVYLAWSICGKVAPRVRRWVADGLMLCPVCAKRLGDNAVQAADLHCELDEVAPGIRVEVSPLS